MMSDSKVRVRFAPSPTGPLHMGGVRTALFNYLFAKKNNGTFILRIEDTDQTRYVPGAEKYIIEALEWCGLNPDEKPGYSCGFGPYRQSERKDIYKTFAQKLISTGHAYYAFDTPEELDSKRKELEKDKKVFTYNAHTRSQMRNSLSLSEDEVTELLKGDYVIRFKMPDNETVEEEDIIRGKVSFNTRELDDKILFKSDGMPTYHLANVVDDHFMKISHVIRGEEWLPSLPLHILLYKSFGWNTPKFAHLPLILKPTGKGKLSKRDGDKAGFPVFPLQWKDPESGDISSGYREEGYFPEAFVNMLAMLGWNPGTEQEIFSMDELIELFSLERVNKSGARFDPEKTKWFNQQHLLRKTDRQLSVLFSKELDKRGIKADENFTEKVVSLVKERVSFVHEIWDQASFFFIAPVEYDPKVVKKRWKGDVPAFMKELAEKLNEVNEWKADKIKSYIAALIEEKGLGFGLVMNALRLALVGGGFGPDLMTIAEMIGKEETIQRIKNAVEKLG
ncbi:MAG: glutamate--tRNA ligase [Chlorobi bacterium]|nr:glutamate--tRNA ligase [Chlorobiota bacterium]